jgi:hypothetical protein
LRGWLGAAITGSIQTHAQELPLLPLVGHLDDSSLEGFVFRQALFREGADLLNCISPMLTSAAELTFYCDVR